MRCRSGRPSRRGWPGSPRAWHVGAFVGLLATACGGGDEPGDASADLESDGRLIVLAAASLTESFTALESALEDQHAGLDISISFGPSSGLVEQVLAGAPADVLATANDTTMDNAVAAGVLDGEPVVFARNTLTIAVPAGNPGGVTSLADLARDELRVALCEPQVPCGAAAEELLDVADVEAAPDTLENDVKDVTGKVALGEVDAALVYRTDAAAETGSIDTVDVPEADRVVNDYPVAVLTDASNQAEAEAFVKALTGEAGRDLLAEAGFVTP